MNNTVAPSPIAATLLERFSVFRRSDQSGTEDHGPGLFSYCTLAHERLAQLELPHPVLGLVLSGTKEVWRGLDQQKLSAGTLFTLPAKLQLDVINDPDPIRGIYQSLILEITPDMISELPRSGIDRHRNGAAIKLSEELIEALSHAATAIARGPTAGSIRQARVSELLALLALEPAAAVLFDVPLADRIAQLVRSRPDHPWTSGAVARLVGMSESTLRRRLNEADSSFSAILRGERMKIAHRMLGQGMASGWVACAVGYASRAHFARAYRRELGHNPGHGDT